MASPAHCIMCFEALDAKLSKRKPLSLADVHSSWAAYEASAKASAPNPALRRVAGDADSASSNSSSSGSLAAGSTPATSTSSLSLGNGSSGSYASTAAADASEAAPLFVTWNILDDDAGSDPEPDDASLRGCIGTFESSPLSENLPEYAVISALHDTRFPPISRGELPSLQVVVTLLTDFEPVDDPFDWVVGVHGVRLSFSDRGRRYGSTYLPDVASEQGWTKDEALFSLIRKAGWMGGRGKWKELDLNVTRYQGKKCKMTYGTYKKWKAWADSNGKGGI